MTASRRRPPAVSLIVPTLHESDRIETTLRRLRRDFPGCELLVVDGGSRDGTPDLARPWAQVITSPPGRGRQLNAGARQTAGDVLWFLHADTVVHPAALTELRSALTDPHVVGGGLTLRFDKRTPGLSYVAWTSNVRARRLSWIFGDQAMFVRRRVFDEVGGFPEIPLMEDLEMSRRLSRTGRLVVLPATSTASARRFEQHGTLRMTAFMQWLKLLYFAGVEPAELARRYAAGPGRRRRPPIGAAASGGTSREADRDHAR